MLAGVSPESARCKNNSGPNITLYFQKHPLNPHQNVNVITFENYISSDFLCKWKENVNDLQFQIRPNSTFFRLSTNHCPDGHAPKLTVGSSMKSMLYEASKEMMPYEVAILKMTKFIYQVIDGEMDKCMALLAKAFFRRSVQRRKN